MNGIHAKIERAGQYTYRVSIFDGDAAYWPGLYLGRKRAHRIARRQMANVARDKERRKDAERIDWEDT